MKPTSLVIYFKTEPAKQTSHKNNTIFDRYFTNGQDFLKTYHPSANFLLLLHCARVFIACLWQITTSHYCVNGAELVN